MAYIQSIKKSLIEQHPETKEKSIDLYITNVKNILKFIIGQDITSDKDLLLIVKNIPLLEEYFDDNNRSDTTRANYYSSLLEVLKAVDNPAAPACNPFLTNFPICGSLLATCNAFLCLVNALALTVTSCDFISALVFFTSSM